MATTISLFDNAIDLISIGVEDLQTEDDRRTSSALRNICAGLILLYKENLRRLSPTGTDEALLRSKFQLSVEGGRILVRGKGKKTVDVSQLIERYKQLDISISAKLLQKLQEMRNDVEHYAPKDPPAQIRSALDDSMHLITEAMSLLDENPGEHFQPDVWDYLVAESGLGRAMREQCRNSRATVDIHPEIKDEFLSLECTECGSDLIQSSGTDIEDCTLQCRYCGAELPSQSVVEDLVERKFSVSVHDLSKGAEPAVDDCPACGASAFHLPGAECLFCREEFGAQECLRCATALSTAYEIENGSCDYCSHVFEKASRE